MCDNGLQMRWGISIIPRFSETKRFPVKAFRGVPEAKEADTEFERGEMGMNGLRRVTGLAVVAGLGLLVGSVLIARAQAPAAGASQDAGAPKYTMAEDNAYQACAAEKVPATLIKCLDDFVSKYPNSTLLNYVYQLYSQGYGAQKNYLKVIEYSDKLAALGDKVDAGTRFTAYYTHVAAYSGLLTDQPKTAGADDAREGWQRMLPPQL